MPDRFAGVLRYRGVYGEVDSVFGSGAAIFGDIVFGNAVFGGLLAVSGSVISEFIRSTPIELDLPYEYGERRPTGISMLFEDTEFAKFRALFDDDQYLDEFFALESFDAASGKWERRLRGRIVRLLVRDSRLEIRTSDEMFHLKQSRFKYDWIEQGTLSRKQGEEYILESDEETIFTENGEPATNPVYRDCRIDDGVYRDHEINIFPFRTEENTFRISRARRSGDVTRFVFSTNVDFKLPARIYSRKPIELATGNPVEVLRELLTTKDDSDPEAFKHVSHGIEEWDEDAYASSVAACMYSPVKVELHEDHEGSVFELIENLAEVCNADFGFNADGRFVFSALAPIPRPRVLPRKGNITKDGVDGISFEDSTHDTYTSWRVEYDFREHPTYGRQLLRQLDYELNPGEGDLLVNGVPIVIVPSIRRAEERLAFPYVRLDSVVRTAIQRRSKAQYSAKRVFAFDIPQAHPGIVLPDGTPAQFAYQWGVGDFLGADEHVYPATPEGKTEVNLRIKSHHFDTNEGVVSIETSPYHETEHGIWMHGRIDEVIRVTGNYPALLGDDVDAITYEGDTVGENLTFWRRNAAGDVELGTLRLAGDPERQALGPSPVVPVVPPEPPSRNLFEVIPLHETSCSSSDVMVRVKVETESQTTRLRMGYLTQSERDLGLARTALIIKRVDRYSDGVAYYDHTFRNLSPNTEFTFWVEHPDHDFDDVVETTPSRSPCPPTVQATCNVRNNLGVATVRWSPNGDGGSPIVGYWFSYRRAGVDAFGNQFRTSVPEYIRGRSRALSSAEFPGKTFEFFVRAVSENGKQSLDGKAMCTFRSVPPPKDPPDAPGAPTLTPADGALEATWNKPADNGSPITQYRARYKVHSSNDADDQWTAHAVARDPLEATTTISGLVNGTRYDVQVAAMNSVGWGDWSGKSTAAPEAAAPQGPPGKPGKPSLSPGDGLILADWDPPASNGSPIQGYQLRRSLVLRTNRNARGWTSITHNGLHTYHTIRGLTNGSEYAVGVRARNASGWGAWSDDALATPRKGAGDELADPTVQSTTRTCSSITLFLLMPQSPIEAVNEVRIEYKGEDDTTPEVFNRRVSGQLPAGITISGLDADTRYTITIKSLSVNHSSDGITINRTTSPITTPETPTGFSATTLSDSQISASWNANSGCTTAGFRYDLRYRQTTTQDWSYFYGLSSTSKTVGNLLPDTEYELQVRADNREPSGNLSGWASAVTATTKPDQPALKAPDAPSRPTLTTYTMPTSKRDDIDIAWLEPNDNGSAITDYDIQIDKAGDSAGWYDHPHSGTGLTSNVNGLSPGTYYIQVRARNAIGPSAWSPIATAIVASITTTQPPPRLASVVCSDRTHNSLDISWAKLTVGEDDPELTGYRIRWVRSGRITSEGWKSADVGTGATSYTITGLEADAVYYIEVTALNNYAGTAWNWFRRSDCRTLTPPPCVPSTPPAPVLSTPGRGQIFVNIGAIAPRVCNAGHAITGYFVSYSGNQVTWNERSAGSPTYTLSNLVDDTLIYVRTRVSNRGGTSQWSPVRSIRTLPAPTPADPPTSVALTIGSTTATLKWKHPFPSITPREGYSYRVQWRKGTTGSWSTRNIAGVYNQLNYSTSFSGLTKGTTYYFRVRVQTDYISNWVTKTGRTSGGTGTGPTDPTDPPDPPGGGSARVPSRPSSPSWRRWVFQGGRHVSVLTGSSPSSNGAELTNWEMQIRRYSGGAFRSTTTISGTARVGILATGTFRTSFSDTEYRARIRWRNSVGWSSWSSYSSTTTPSSQ